MKKKLAILLSALLIMTFTGCMRMSVDINVNTDGTADLSLLYAMKDSYDDIMEDMDFGGDTDSDWSDDETSDWDTEEDSDWTEDEDFDWDTEEDSTEDEDVEESEGMTESDIADLEAKGFTYEEYAEGGYTGYVISAKNKPLNELGSAFSDAQDDTGLSSDEFTVTQNGGNYTLDWKVMDEESASQMAQIKDYVEPYEGFMRVVITLPEAAVESNATEVSDDGKTLTWNLLSMAEDTNIHLVFADPVAKGGSMGKIIGVAVVIIVVIVAAVLLTKKKKPEEAPAFEAAPAVTPDAPEAPATESEPPTTEG